MNTEPRKTYQAFIKPGKLLEGYKDALTQDVTESFHHGLRFSFLCLLPLAAVSRKMRKKQSFPAWGLREGPGGQLLWPSVCPPTLPLARM